MNLVLPRSAVRSLLLVTVLAAPALTQNLVELRNGTPANANDVNANFNALKTAVQAAQAAADSAQATAAGAEATANAATPLLQNLTIGIGSVTSALTVTSPQVAIDRRIQFPATVANRRVVLFPANDNDHQFVGLGVATNALRYQVTGAGDSHVFFAGATPTTSTELMRVQGNGNVGIGVPSPTARLDLAGNLRVRVGDQIRFGADNENDDPVFLTRLSGQQNESVLSVNVGDEGSSVDRIDFNMSAGGGVTFQFLGNGSALKPGGGSWGTISDVRKKQNVQPLAGALDRLLELRGARFEYVDPTEAGTGPGVHTGFIAQEVEKVFPEWVGELADGTKYLTISGFEAQTVEALRELAARNTALAAENEVLRTRVATLEALVADVAQMRTALQSLLAK